MMDGQAAVADKGTAVAGLEPDDFFVVGDLATLRLLAHPLRLRILEALRDRPRTVKELAAALEVGQTGLYHHVNKLAERGVVRVVATRQVSGITEKRYRVAAHRLTVDRALFAPGAPAGDDAFELFLSLVLDEARAELRKSVRAGLVDPSRGEDLRGGGLVLGRNWWRLTPAGAEAFQAGMDELQRRLGDAQAPPDDPAARTYEHLIGFYPVLPRDVADAGDSPGLEDGGDAPSGPAP
jgi:DNA-binding transcriptional ArsR family regulator